VTKQIDLDELERLYAAATPGEWAADETGPIRGIISGPLVVANRRQDRAAIVALHNAFPAMFARLRALENEEAISYELITKQGDLLHRIAVALRGPEPPLPSWGHHDLPERTEALVSRLRALEAVAEAAREVWEVLGPVIDSADALREGLA